MLLLLAYLVANNYTFKCLNKQHTLNINLSLSLTIDYQYIINKVIDPTLMLPVRQITNFNLNVFLKYKNHFLPFHRLKLVLKYSSEYYICGVYLVIQFLELNSFVIISIQNQFYLLLELFFGNYSILGLITMRLLRQVKKVKTIQPFFPQEFYFSGILTDFYTNRVKTYSLETRLNIYKYRPLPNRLILLLLQVAASKKFKNLIYFKIALVDPK